MDKSKVGKVLENLEYLSCISGPEAFRERNIICEAKHLIKEMAKELETKAGMWKSVDDELPEPGATDLLVMLKNGAVFSARYSMGKEEFQESSSMGVRDFHEDNPVVKWMHMPEGDAEE